METTVVWGILAFVFAFVATFFFVDNMLASVRHRIGLSVERISDFYTDPIKALIAWRVRNGILVLKPFGNRLLCCPRIKAAVSEALRFLEERGCPSTLSSTSSLLLGFAMLIALATGLAAQDVIAGVIVGLCAFSLVVVGLSARCDRGADAARDSIIDALDSLAACLGSGMTLVQTFRQVAADTGGELGKTFQSCAGILDTGGSTSDALGKLKACDFAPELAFVAVALDVHHQSGGSIVPVLEAAAESAKSECALRRSLRVQTAQARLSARVVAVMPFILVAAFSIASPGFLNPFFESLAGYALLLVAVGMQVLGVVLVRHTLSAAGAQ